MYTRSVDNSKTILNLDKLNSYDIVTLEYLMSFGFSFLSIMEYKDFIYFDDALILL
jgi:hypothetical protein